MSDYKGPFGLPRFTPLGPFTSRSVTPSVTVINGDSRSVIDELLKNSDVRDGVDAIITDPPYGIGVASFGNVAGGIEGDENVGQALDLFESVMDGAKMLLKDGGPVLSFAGDQTLCSFINEYVEDAYEIQQVLVWDKGKAGPPFDDVKWRFGYEMIIHSSNGPPSYINSNSTDSDVLSFRSIVPNQYKEKLHPTEKPIDLMEYLITSVTQPGDTVLDPFMGSGSTGVACQNTGREFIGVEIDEGFYNTAVERLSDND